MSEEQPTPTPAPGRFPCGLLGMLVVVGLIELIVGHNGMALTSQQEFDWATTRQTATTNMARESDILCFGDSLVKFGIAPRLLGATLERPAYSLAMLDGKPTASYYMFRHALASGARPKAVIVDFQPEMVSQDSWCLLDNGNWAFSMLGLAEILEMSWHYRDSNFLGKMLLTRTLPTVRCRYQLRMAILNSLSGKGNYQRIANLPVRRNFQINRGGMLLARDPSYHGDVPKHYANVMYEKRWKSNRANAYYVQQFLKLAEAHKIHVFWLLPPNTPEILEWRRENGLFDRHDAFIRRGLARFGNVTVLDPRLSGYDHTNFVDPVHLDRNGAIALTLDVAHAIEQALAPHSTAPQWIALPPYRKPDVKLALEDVHQSTAAIHAERARQGR